jgi:hypothetical protein
LFKKLKTKLFEHALKVSLKACSLEEEAFLIFKENNYIFGRMRGHNTLGVQNAREVLQMVQPITAKELEYIADSMSNEDLLLKQNAVLASSSSNQAFVQAARQFIATHQQHYQTLLQTLHQHSGMAPTQPQQ